MSVTAQQVFRDLEQGRWQPFYLIVGEEPFQVSEIVDRIKQTFLKAGPSDFGYESFEGLGCDVNRLLVSLETLPGFFDTSERRLVSCFRIDGLSVAGIETLLPYFQKPSESTVFFMTAAKVDKRKAWVRAVEQKGVVIEVSEPYVRDWPKWKGYLEKKLGKKVEEAAWQICVESGGLLSLVWAELTKAALFVGDNPTITANDMATLRVGGSGEDVFKFIEEVISRQRLKALCRLERLKRAGEPEIKILSLLVRHFRQIEAFHECQKAQLLDPRAVAQKVGLPLFFLGKLKNQAALYSSRQLTDIFHLLATADYAMKRGQGGVWENVLIEMGGVLG